MLQKNPEDRAGRSYWNDFWEGRETPRPMDPEATDLDQYPDRKFDALFRKLFEDRSWKGKRLIEVGCGRSRWLPYMNRRFGFSVAGLDYSFLGAWQAREILRQAGVEGEIVCGDLFAPPGLAEQYDVCVSYGLIEHFEDTTATVRALADFLKPGGMLISMIPNFSGWMGRLQRWMNRPVFDAHVPLSLEALCAAHQSAGLDTVHSGYWMTLHTGVINIATLDSKSWRTFLIKNAWRALWVITLLAWWLDEHTGWDWPNKWTSPYAVCVGVKPKLVTRSDS